MIEDLIDFLGISSELPTNFIEFIPYFFTILVSVIIVFAVFKFIFKIAISVMNASKHL